MSVISGFAQKFFLSTQMHVLVPEIFDYSFNNIYLVEALSRTVL